MTFHLLTLFTAWPFSLTWSAGGAFALLHTEGEGPSPERISKALDDVFARREFDTTPPWINLAKMLADFFAWLGSLSGSAPVLFWVLVIGCVVVLTLLLIHISWAVLSVISAAQRARREMAGQQQRRYLSGSYATAADQAARAGDFTEAVRCLFLCLVYHFDESGRISFLPAGTNREYLGRFADRPAVHRDLAVFVDTLDDNWYGQRPTPPEQYRQCRDRFDSIYRLS
jgi:Domain of unknown function (DUF4129)